MKKYFYFLAIAVLFAACQNNQNEELGTPFQKGQKVTLSATIANPNGGAKQMPGKQRVSGLDDTPDSQTNGAIKLTWNEGDEIKVTVNGVSSNFTLKDGAGTAEGVFEGFMPAEGTTYTVDYPVTTPNLANQTYVKNGFGDELMTMHAENGDLSGFTLEAQNALLGLQLRGSKRLSDIVVTNRKTGDKYTLDCRGAFLENAPKLFYIVVPAGEWQKGFKVEVLEDDESLIADFEKTSSATFTPNQAMVMPPKVADYQLKTLTFEDWTNPADKSFDPYELQYDEYFTIETWSDLIDPDQGSMFWGGLLYGAQYGASGFDPTGWIDPEYRYADCYCWYDEYNTKLAHFFATYQECGIAISNIASEDYESNKDWTTQLTAFGTSGHSGTNFCVANAGYGVTDPATPIFFGDENERVIDHIYVNLTTLMYASALGEGPNGSMDQLDDDDTYTLVVTGYNRNDEVTGTAKLDLYKKGTFIDGWTKLNLAFLGKVASIKFCKVCEKENIPSHFAFDDIAVRFQIEE